MTVYIGILILCAFASDPFKGGAMYLLINLQSLASTEVGLQVPTFNLALYLIFAITISLTVICLLLIMMRFVFRVDLSLLANCKGQTNPEPLPPMTVMQKLVLADFLFYVIWLLLPSFLGPDNQVGIFLRQNQMTGSVVVLILSIVVIGGKRVVNVPETNSKYP